MPIVGDNIIVMNCLWILRRAKGHNLGKHLLNNMIESEKNAAGFATIALENHWSPWMKREQIERLGFKPIDSIKLKHKTKHTDQTITVYLMWLPKAKAVSPPTWNAAKLLEGINFCMGYPLYNPESLKQKQIFKKQ